MSEKQSTHIELELEHIINDSSSYFEMVDKLNKRLSNEGLDFNFIRTQILMNTNLMNHKKAVNMFKDSIGDMSFEMFGQEQELYLDTITNITDLKIGDGSIDEKQIKNFSKLIESSLKSEAPISYESLSTIGDSIDVLLESTTKEESENLKEEYVKNLIALKLKSENTLLGEEENSYINNEIYKHLNKSEYSQKESLSLKLALEEDDFENEIVKEYANMAKFDKKNREYVKTFAVEDTGHIDEYEYNPRNHIINIEEDLEAERLQSLMENQFIERNTLQALKDKVKLPSNRKGYTYMEPLLGTTIFNTVDVGNNKLIPKEPILNIKDNKFTGTRIMFTSTSFKDEAVHKHAAKEAKSRGIKTPNINLPKNVSEDQKYTFLKLATEALLEAGYEPDKIKLGSGIGSDKQGFRQALEETKNEYVKNKTFEHGGLSDNSKERPDAEFTPESKQENIEKQNLDDSLTPEELEAIQEQGPIIPEYPNEKELIEEYMREQEQQLQEEENKNEQRKSKNHKPKLH